MLIFYFSGACYIVAYIFTALFLGFRLIFLHYTCILAFSGLFWALIFVFTYWLSIFFWPLYILFRPFSGLNHCFRAYLTYFSGFLVDIYLLFRHLFSLILLINPPKSVIFVLQLVIFHLQLTFRDFIFTYLHLMSYYLTYLTKYPPENAPHQGLTAFLSGIFQAPSYLSRVSYARMRV